MPPPARQRAFQVALVYTILAGCWIALFSELWPRFTSGFGANFALKPVEDGSLVLGTGGLLYLTLRRWSRRRDPEMEPRKDTEKNLRRTEWALKVLSACNGVLVRANCEATLLSEICRVIVEKGGYRMAWVGFAENDEPKTIRLAAQAGCDEGSLALAKLACSDPNRPGLDPVGAAIRTGQIGVCHDVQTDAKAASWRTQAAGQGYASLITLPLNHAGKTFGVFTLHAAEINAFDPAAVALLAELADDLAYGIQALRTRIARELATEALRASEGRLQFLLTMTPAIIYSLRPIGDFATTFVSPNVREVLGYESEAFNHDPVFWLTHVHPDDVPGAVARFHQLSTSGTISHEYRFRHRDGGYRWLQDEMRVVRDPQGGVQEFVGYWFDITERKLTEQKLRENEQRYRLLFELESDAVMLLDCETHRIVDVNQSAQRLYGYSREQFLQLRPEDISDEPAKTQTTVGSGNVFVALRWHRKQNGQRFAVEIAANQIDYQGRRLELAAIRDITARQQVMDMLRETTGQLMDAQRIAKLGSFRIDTQVGTWTSSKALDELFGIGGPGFTRDMAGWLKIVHPEERSEMQRHLHEEVFSGRTAFDRIYRIVRLEDLEERWVHGLGKLVRDDGGQVVQLAGAIQDITERKRAEEQLNLQASALTATANAIIITDHAGRIEWVNPSFTKLTGYSAAEAIGGNPRLLKSGRHPEEFYSAMWATITSGNVWHGEMVNKHKDGRLSTEATTITPVRGANGQIAHFVAVKQDVTEHQQLEAQLRQSQKMDAIGQLAGGVAHDFNNILSALLMQTELLETIEHLPVAVLDGLKQIRADANRAADLTRQLLQFGRRQVMQPRNLDLNHVVANMAKMIARIIGEDVQMRINLHPAPLLTHADVGMIEQVLMNLVVNARDAMPEGGRLRIETAENDVDEAGARLHSDATPGRYVCVSVSDTGSGIPPEVLPRIFEPFFTTKKVGKGTGLGLATVFGIVKQHAGWIRVDNHPGQGVTFWIYLPASTVTAAAAAATEAKPKPRGGGETILLAEDEPGVRRSLRVILERQGYQVLEAANGIEALDLWLVHRRKVALLLTDLVMPGGLNGQEVAQQLRAAQPSLKVIYTSGYSPEIAGRELPLRAGENFVSKPFVLDELLETVRRCLDGP